MPNILIEKTGAVATVVLSNTGKLNAIDVSMWRALNDAFRQLSQDESLRCVILQGEAGNFAAGADIEEFAQVRSTMEQGIAYHLHIIGNALQAISHCQRPTIAAIEGVCVGGGLEIACDCVLRFAAPSSRFGIPVNRLGFPLAPGELQGLLELIGKAATMEILLEGRVFDAAEAKDKGLLHRIVDDVSVEARFSAWRFAAGAPLAAGMMMVLMRRLSAWPACLSELVLRAGFSFLV